MSNKATSAGKPVNVVPAVRAVFKSMDKAVGTFNNAEGKALATFARFVESRPDMTKKSLNDAIKVVREENFAHLADTARDNIASRLRAVHVSVTGGTLEAGELEQASGTREARAIVAEAKAKAAPDTRGAKKKKTAKPSAKVVEFQTAIKKVNAEQRAALVSGAFDTASRECKLDIITTACAADDKLRKAVEKWLADQ